MNHLFNRLRIIVPLLVIAVFMLSFQSNEKLSDKEFVRKIVGYNALYKHEKAFIHTDKPIYFSGEELWFSGFLLDAASGQLNANERVLYVELLKPNGSIAHKTFYMLKNGRAKGSITLNENLKSGNYLLVAYTNWMRNAGTDYFFKKPLIILNETKETNSLEFENDSIITDHATTETTATQEQINEQEPPKLNLAFFPEGGDLIAGLASKVAFEATDQNGANMTVAGSIVDETGNLVATLNTLWNGRGYFTLMPIEGKTYKAQIKSTDGQSFSFDLPKIRKEGYALVVENTPKSPNILVSISRKSIEGKSTAFLLVMQNQKPIYALSDTIAEKAKTFSIPKHIFKTGIAQFTLFDNKRMPRCERLSLINKDDAIQLSVKKMTTDIKQRQKIALTIEAKDKSGAPASGTFAIAITDAKRVSEESYSSSNFVNFLNFGSDLPNFNGNISELLEPGMKGMIKSELIMLTSGWRRYKWSEVLKDKIELPQHKVEPGIYIKGQIYKNENKKRVPPEGLDISMMIPKRFDAYNQLTDEKGEFSFLLKDFHGTSDAVLQTKNRMNMKKDFLIDLSTNLKTSRKGKKSNNKITETTKNNSLYFTGGEVDSSIYAEKGSLAKDLQRAIDFNFYLDTTDVTIDEVTIVADKARNAKEAVIKRYGPAQRSIGKEQIKTLAEEKKWHTGLLSLIEDAIPGLLTWYNPLDEEIRFIPKDKRRHRFYVYVDGQMVAASDDKGSIKSLLNLHDIYELAELDPDVVEAIDLIYPPKEVADPTADFEATSRYSIDAIVPIDSDPNAASSLDTGEDAIGDAMKVAPTLYTSPPAILSIYTKDGTGLNSQTHFKGILKLELTGFAKEKEYYQPNYSSQKEIITSDQRTTLLWEPELNIDSTGTAEITFYNSDLGHLFRIDAIGLSSTGTPGEIRTTLGTEIPLAILEKPSSDPLNNAIDVPYEPEWSSDSKMKVKVLRPDGHAAAYADISVADGSWGNMTDGEGIFFIDMEILAKNTTLIISDKGEASVEIKISEVLKGNKQITLQPVAYAATDIEADKLSVEILKSLFRNKPSRITYPTGIYREEVYWNKELHRLLDLSLTLRVPSIKDSYQNYAVQPIVGQLYKTSAYDNKALFAPHTNTSFHVNAMDAIHDDLTVLDRDNLKFYDFKLEGQTLFQNRDVYKLSFDQKADAPYSMLKGYMLVDIATKGITYIQWSTSDKGAKYIVQDSYIMGSKRFENFELKSDNNTSTYQLINGKWEIKSGTQQVQFSINNKPHAYKREFIATGHAKNQDFKFRPTSVDEMEARFVLIKTPKYNLQNWRDAWFIPSTEIIRKNIPFMHEVLMLKSK